MERKKVVYISGPITGVERYWEAFEEAEEDLLGLGYIPLSPAHLPEGMSSEQYAHIDLAMIDSADAVLCLSRFDRVSTGVKLELDYCAYINKPVVFSRRSNHFGDEIPRDVAQVWLKHDLEEVLNK